MTHSRFSFVLAIYLIAFGLCSVMVGISIGIKVEPPKPPSTQPLEGRLIDPFRDIELYVPVL